MAQAAGADVLSTLQRVSFDSGSLNFITRPTKSHWHCSWAVFAAQRIERAWTAVVPDAAIATLHKMNQSNMFRFAALMLLSCAGFDNVVHDQIQCFQRKSITDWISFGRCETFNRMTQCIYTCGCCDWFWQSFWSSVHLIKSKSAIIFRIDESRLQKSLSGTPTIALGVASAPVPAVEGIIKTRYLFLPIMDYLMEIFDRVVKSVAKIEANFAHVHDRSTIDGNHFKSAAQLS